LGKERRDMILARARPKYDESPCGGAGLLSGCDRVLARAVHLDLAPNPKKPSAQTIQVQTRAATDGVEVRVAFKQERRSRTTSA